MPVIMATPYPTRGQVLVEVDMADVPAATNVCVEAVNTVTRERRQLHPYISYNGDGCLTLSCGKAIFWDTEIPCGIAVQYCATAISATGTTVTTTAAPLVTDTFTRVVANGWGTADSGQAWTTSGGAVGDYSTTGTRAQVAITSVNVARRTQLDGPQPNGNAVITMYPPVLATGALYSGCLMLRRDAVANSEYGARIDFLSGGTTANLSIYRNVGGSITTLTTVALADAYAAGVPWRLRLQVWGSTISASAWLLTSPEPAFPLTSTTDTNLSASAGQFGVRTIANTGNLNTPFNMQYDDFQVLDVCAEPVAVTTCTTNVTIACDGCFRLGDPLRPCNDIQICFCYDTTTCGGTGGTFFAGMTADIYGSNTGIMAPVNSINPIPITRNRRAATGSFYVVPTSFVARDALLALLAPGGPLLWRGPAEYGTGDRYIQIGDLPVAPVLPDLRVQPRTVELPFAIVKAPVGPSQGICGTRFEDLCDVYASWDAMIAAGLTYADILRGQAGSTPANLPNWNLVNATYATWNALNAAQTSWNDTLAGVP